MEERVQTQALSVDLREAVMACLCGGESRRWTVGELLDRFKNLGICASRASVTAALAELGLELELSGWAPWRLLERGTEWILAPKSELVELLSGVRRLPVKEARILSEEHKAVLLVVIGYRQKGGVSKARVGEILGLEASSYLDDLLSQGLIYCDPSRELDFWRPTQSDLLALGLRSHTDIPALKELEEWFDAQEEIRAVAKLDPFFERTSKLASRRIKREIQACQKRKQIAKHGSWIVASHRSTSFSVILRQFSGHFRGVPLAGAAHIAAIKAVSRRLAMEGFLTKRICFASL